MFYSKFRRNHCFCMFHSGIQFTNVHFTGVVLLFNTIWYVLLLHIIQYFWFSVVNTTKDHTTPILRTGGITMTPQGTTTRVTTRDTTLGMTNSTTSISWMWGVWTATGMWMDTVRTITGVPTTVCMPARTLMCPAAYRVIPVRKIPAKVMYGMAFHSNNFL